MLNNIRKNIRLTNHDYSSDGSYFIIICTKDKECYFGEIKNNKMVFTSVGEIAQKYLAEISSHFENVKLEEFVIMPNHVHCLLNLSEANVGTRHVVSLQNESNMSLGTSHVMSLPDDNKKNQFSKPIPGSVSVIVQQFKSSVKRWCNQNGYSYFQWQSRFHDHVIRNYDSYLEIKNYIHSNVANWSKDSLYNLISKGY